MSRSTIFAGIRPYLIAFRAVSLMQLQYRAAAISGFLTQFAFGWVRMEIFTAVLLHAPVQAMSVSQTTTYVWLTQAFLVLILANGERGLSEAVRSGNLGIELLRPIDCYSYWFVQALAKRLVPAALRAGPMLLVCSVTGLLAPPASPLGLVCAIAALAAGLLVATALAMLVASSSLWLVAGDGLATLVPALLWSLSGVIVPVALLPDGLRAVIEALPFVGILDTPIRLYTGVADPSCAPALIARQLLWTIALIALGWAAVRRGLHRAEIAGG